MLGFRQIEKEAKTQGLVDMIHTLKNWLMEQGISDNLAGPFGWIGVALGVLILALVANYVAKHFLLVGVRYFVAKTKTEWDDVLLHRKVFSRLSHLAPALVIYFTASMFPETKDTVQRISIVYMILAGLGALNSFLSAVNDIYDTFNVSKERPIKGYVQIVKIIITVFVLIVTVAVLMDRSPWTLLTGIGAMTAVLILVFKDTILGLVASVQLSMNSMVRIGDWIEMPKYGADGDVIDITLHTVKVQNWDKTITTIPSYSLISDSFKNWRGMSESQGRRIKRAVNIDMSSVRFCTESMLNQYEKFQLITDNIRSKRGEIASYNSENNIDTSELINGRNLTNIGTFRAYMVAYLQNHPMINKDMTFLIRQLAPRENGLPLEVYVFSSDKDWIRYEGIMSDIFDHLLAVLPMFDLRVFQNPTGFDFSRLGK